MGLFDWLSLGLDIIPGIGEVKAVLELLSGKDAITQEDLNLFDRVTSALSIIPILGKLAKLSKAHKAAKHANKFKRLFYLVDKANKANKKLDKIKILKQIFEDTSLTCGEPDYKYTNNKDYDDSEDEDNSGALKSLDEISDEVIDGLWGNGNERKKRLEEAGYDYYEVQDEVNRKLYG